MVPTAAAASSRAPCAACRINSASEPRPHSAETITAGKPREVSPLYRNGSSWCSTKIPAKVTTPATTAVTTAHRRKYSTISSSAVRRASQTR